MWDFSRFFIVKYFVFDNKNVIFVLSLKTRSHE